MNKVSVSNASVSYEEGLLQDLRNPEEAAAYLNAALEEGSQEVFLLALRDVAKARGISQLAQDTSLNRENIYRILSDNGNPQLSSLKALLEALGLKLAVEPITDSAKLAQSVDKSF
ncbi:MAG: putative addiction module antidote protein [Chloroflexi bacterium]|nr:putative addiction module antidote protein [Chloroflexota bacterium]